MGVLSLRCAALTRLNFRYAATARHDPGRNADDDPPLVGNAGAAKCV